MNLKLSTFSCLGAIGAALLLAACVASGPLPSNEALAPRPGQIVNTHAHLAGVTSGGPGGPHEDYLGAARAGIAAKDRHGIAFSLLMPPPREPGTEDRYTFEIFRSVLARWPDRYGVVGGGTLLNPLIHAIAAGRVDAADRKRFTERAEAMVAAGVKGFGEFTALHLSMQPWHPFLEVAPDHPLFLLLADIAARHGLPVDIHMEAVARDRETPPRYLRRSHNNPAHLQANIAAFERLLAHNRQAKIIWAHIGWDNTGERTPKLLRRLLAAHSNLYLAINVGPRPFLPNQMLTAEGVDPAWLALIRDHADRFLMGMDTFHRQRGQGHNLPNTVPRNRRFFDALPADLQRKVGYENALRVFRLRN
jgi:predicted TIM-barrel fold metal-dependent hydrolase